MDSDNRKKLMLIYNARAGKSAICPVLSDVIDLFTKGGYDVTTHPTQSARDAEATALRTASAFDMVVCAGGDGTLAETATGVYLSGAGTPIGYLPCGSTNDYATSISLPKTLIDAARTVVEGKMHSFDLGRFNDRYFIYVAAFGWFSDVSYATDQNLKNMFGHAAYLLEAGKRIFKMPEYNITVRANGEEFTEKIVYGMISNARSIGGMKGFGWKDVDMDDGLFEVTLAKKPSTMIELGAAFSSLISSEPSEHIIRFKCSEVEIESEKEFKWTIDGEEAQSCRSVKAENLHKAIQLMVKADKS